MIEENTKYNELVLWPNDTPLNKAIVKNRNKPNIIITIFFIARTRYHHYSYPNILLN